MEKFLRKILGTALSVVIASTGIVCRATADTAGNQSYNFEDGMGAWQMGSVRENTSEFSVVTEGQNSFARLSMLPGTTFYAYNDRPNVTPDAKLDLSENPYVLGKSTHSVISSKFRVNHKSEGEYPRVTFSMNYDDTGSADDTESNIFKRYAYNYNVLWSISGSKVLNYTHWNKNTNPEQPNTVDAYGGFTENTWYKVASHIWTDTEGKISYVSVRVYNENGEQLSTGEVNVNSNNPLRQVTQIENIGFEMMGRTGKNVTSADGYNVDFDNVAIYNFDTAEKFLMLDNTFINTFSQFRIQLGMKPADGYTISIINEDGDELDCTSVFDEVTNILTVSMAETQPSGEYYVSFNNGYVDKTATIIVKGCTSEDIIFDFENGLSGWNQRNNLSGVAFEAATEGGRSFARITVDANKNFNNYYNYSIDTYPVVKIDLDQGYKFKPNSTVVVSSDIRSNVTDVFINTMKINNDKSDGGQYFNTLWRWKGTAMNNYSFTNDGTAQAGNWIIDYGWPAEIRPNQGSAKHYTGEEYNNMTTDRWYTVKVVYVIGDDGKIAESNYYLFDDDGTLLDKMEKDAHIADSLKDTTMITRIGFELIGQNVATSKSTTFDFDNVSVKSYNSASVIDASGTEQETVSANTNYYGKYTYFNDTTSNMDIDGIIAVYEKAVDGTYRLVNVKARTQTVEPGNEITFATLSPLNSENCTMIKNFLWSTELNAPLCKNVTLGE